MLSNTLGIIEEKGLRTEDNDFTFRIASGIVGAGVANAFNTWVKNTRDLISPEEIAKDPKKAPVPKKERIDVLHATVACSEHFIKKKKNNKYWREFLVYGMRIQPE